MKPNPKTLKALVSVLKALGPLEPEARRQVIEATHTLIDVAPGKRQNQEPKQKAGRKRR